MGQQGVLRTSSRCGCRGSAAQPGHIIRRAALLVGGICVCLLGSLGCAEPIPRVVLSQPQLEGLQCRLRLTSEQVVWAESDDEHRLLAEFPLPGAATGAPAYVLYLRFWVAPSRGGSDWTSSRERGFLVQTRGQYAGLTVITAGSARVTALDPERRKAALDLEFEDGSRLTGELLARRNERTLRAFETERYREDVQLLEAQRP